MTDQPHRRAHARWPYAVYAALSVAFCAPLFSSPNGLGINDWDTLLFYYGSVLKSVVEYGQMPFWNPWYCGGNVLWQNPQAPLLTPAFPLAAVMSLPLAMKITIVLHYWVGFIGMHLLLTSGFGLTFLPLVMYLAAVGTLSGALVMHLSVGHSVFLPCFYLPLQLYFCVRAMRGGAVRDVMLAAGLVALMIYAGAVQVVPMSVGAIGLLGLFAAIGQRRWRPLLVAIGTAVAGFALAAPKLLPVLLWLASDKFWDARLVLERPDRMTVEMLLRTYLDRFQHRGLHFDLQRSPWHEYGDYIGVLAASLIAGAVIWALFTRKARERWLGAALALTTVVLFALSAGEFAPWAPASIAAHLPLLSSFRIPSRYTIAAVLFGVATLGWVLQALDADGTIGARSRAFVAIVCVLAGLDLFLTNTAQFARVFSIAPMSKGFAFRGGPQHLEVDATSSPYTPDSPVFRSLMNNRAFYQCYEPLQTKRTSTPDGPLVQASGDARVFDFVFSPNRVEFTVAAGRDASEVRLNQNFADGWRSSAGRVTPSKDGGQPSVTLAPGQTGKFAFSYVPPGLASGIIILLVMSLIVLVTWRRVLPDW